MRAVPFVGWVFDLVEWSGMAGLGFVEWAGMGWSGNEGNVIHTRSSSSRSDDDDWFVVVAALYSHRVKKDGKKDQQDRVG